MLHGKDIFKENKYMIYDVLLRKTEIKECVGVKNYIIIDCGVAGRMNKTESL